MRDSDIRPVLLQSLHKMYENDSDTLIIEELGLCQGNSRIDVAVVNGVMHGYEIKSERDSLSRLPGQQAIYNKIFDYVTVISSSCHIPIIKQQIPDWWGIYEAITSENGLILKNIRPCKRNIKTEAKALVQLLWRDEALDILKKRNLHKGLSSKTREIIWSHIVKYLSINKIRLEVRKKFKIRKHWRVALQRQLHDV